MQSMLDKSFHLVAEERLEMFELPDGSMYTQVRSVFQVWEKMRYFKRKSNRRVYP